MSFLLNEMHKTWWYDLNLLFIITCVLSFFLLSFISLTSTKICWIEWREEKSNMPCWRMMSEEILLVCFSKCLWRIIELEEKIFFERWKIAFSLSRVFSKNDNAEIGLMRSIILQSYSFFSFFSDVYVVYQRSIKKNLSFVIDSISCLVRIKDSSSWNMSYSVSFDREKGERDDACWCFTLKREREKSEREREKKRIWERNERENFAFRSSKQF